MIRLALGLLALLVLAAPARADDNRPLTITIAQDQTGVASVRWKIPANVEARTMPEIAAPESCEVSGQARNWSDPLGHWREQQWHCSGSLSGASIAIDYPGLNPNLATIARVTIGTGETQTLVMQPGETVLSVPTPQQQQAQGGTFLRFLQLGFEHIWEGFDHLLFVTGLIIVAGTWRRILVTVTGFTVAHSITLALSALDLVQLPIRAVEAAIALSIVFLAVEIARGPRDSLTWRRPVTVAAAFGLLHGFGFASVLREIGLPQDGFVSALLAFNIGIEIGQVIFAALVFGAIMLLARAKTLAARPELARNLAGYGLGIVASYWLFERLSLV